MTKCGGFAERLNFASPREYLDIVGQLIELVGQGAFLLVHASCPLKDIRNTPWPADIIFHDLQWTMCGRAFQLFADTYHGRASWTPGDVPSSNRDTIRNNIGITRRSSRVGCHFEAKF
jgi:hypothetical protein